MIYICNAIDADMYHNNDDSGLDQVCEALRASLQLLSDTMQDIRRSMTTEQTISSSINSNNMFAQVMTFGEKGMERIDPIPQLPLYCKVKLCNQGDREGAVISGPNEHGAYKCVTISNYDNRFFTLDTYCRPLSKKFGIGVYFYDSLEAHDEAEVLDMIARAEAADTKRANDKAEAKAVSDKLIIDLPAMYPHLKPLSKGIAYRDLKKEKKANMIAELKKHFPYVRFSVRNEYHDTYNIEWTGGPTEKEVSALTNKFGDHKTAHTGDDSDPC